MTKLLLVSLLLSIGVLQIHNSLSYPIDRGFDARDHLHYVNFLKTEQRIPLANEGWELYQPPLYYILASIFPDNQSIRLLGFASWILLIYLSYIFFGFFYKKTESILTGVLIVSSLPVVLYLTPAIGNEFFSSVVIGIALAYYATHRKKTTTRSSIVLGILLGLAMLSKATAFVLVASIVINEVWNSRLRMQKIIKALAIPLGITLLIAGWFYIRNIIVFHNPFMSSIDFPQYKIVQVPGYRDLKFFTDLSGFIKLEMFTSHFTSLWSGTYFSFFYDGHNALIPVQQYSKIGILLFLLSLPLFLISLVGFCREVKNINEENRILIIYPLLLFTGYVLYTIKLPFYSTVKGAFIASLAIPFGYFFLKGRNILKKHSRFIVIYLVLYIVVVVKNFWILQSWYRP